MRPIPPGTSAAPRFRMNQQQLRERTKVFAKRVVKFCRALPCEWDVREMGKQLLRSGGRADCDLHRVASNGEAEPPEEAVRQEKSARERSHARLSRSRKLWCQISKFQNFQISKILYPT